MHILDTSGIRYEIFLELGNIIAPIKQSICLLSVGSTKAYERALAANRESASKQVVRGSDEYLSARVGSSGLAQKITCTVLCSSFCECCVVENFSDTSFSRISRNDIMIVVSEAARVSGGRYVPD